MRLCAFVPFHAMRLMNIGMIDETPKGPPVEALVQWQARTLIHLFEVGVLHAYVWVVAASLIRILYLFDVVS